MSHAPPAPDSQSDPDRVGVVSRPGPTPRCHPRQGPVDTGVADTLESTARSSPGASA